MSVEAGVLESLSGLVGRLGQVGQKRRGNRSPRPSPGWRCWRKRCYCSSLQWSGDWPASGPRRPACSSVDFDLEGVQGGLVGLGRQALSQAGVDSHEAGSIGQDGSLCCGEVCSQSVGPELRAGRPPGPAVLRWRRRWCRCRRCFGSLSPGGCNWVRTRESCPAEMPCNSMTGGGVCPSSRTRPVRVEGNNDISVSREQTRRCPTR